MKIFASWSGDHSKRVALLVKVWLEDVLQGCSVWVSSENIEKGSMWFSDVADTLKDTSFGILCVTSHNATAPWLLFEAGALSKGLTANRVSPLLVDISPTDLKPPLSLLNATIPTQDDMFRLVRDINTHSRDHRLDDVRLERAFRRCWPEFGSQFEALSKTSSAGGKITTKRPDREILEEIAEMTKLLVRSAQEGNDIRNSRMHDLEARAHEYHRRHIKMTQERDFLLGRLKQIDLRIPTGSSTGETNLDFEEPFTPLESGPKS